MKTLLINHFGDALAFIYLQDKLKSQMFHLSTAQTKDVIETLRLNDPIEVCVKKLNLNVNRMILVLIKAFDMQMTYNSGWRSFNLTIAYNVGTSFSVLFSLLALRLNQSAGNVM